MDGRSGPEAIRWRLRYLRDRVLRLTVQGLAEQLKERGVKDYSVASISRYETRDPLPRADYVAAMAQLGGCSADWLLFGEEEALEPEETFHPADREMIATLAETALESPARAADMMRVIVRILRGDTGDEGAADNHHAGA